MAAKKITAKPISSFDDLDAAGIGVGYQPFAADAVAPMEAPAEPERTWGAVAKDVGVSALKGAIAVPEAAVGMADLLSGGRAGKVLEDVGFRPGEAKAILDEQYSDKQKQAFQSVSQAEGFTGKMGAALANPSVIGHTLVESAPLMGMGGVIGRGVMAAAPRVSSVIAGAIGEGAVGAGSSAEAIRQASQDGTLTGKQAALAGASGALTGAFTLLGGKVAQKLGITDVDTMLAGAATNPAVRKGVVRSALEGAAAEGILEELPQSVQEQVLQNAALGKPLDEGVDQAAVMGLLSGMAMGGGANAVSSFAKPPAQAAADTIRATETVPESGPMTRASNAATEAKAQAIEAGAPLVDEQATAEPMPELVDDPVRDQILALPDGARQDALRAYAVVNRTDVAKGVQQYNRKLLDRLLTENAPPPVLGESLTGTDMGTMLGGGGMAGNTDPLMGALGMGREAQANSITNVANVAERRPPMPASDAARMLDEARNRGLDLAVAEHPAGGFVLVPPNWVTPDMAAQGETRLAETIARMQQADSAPVERAPRTRTEPVDLSLPTDPVQNYMDTLRTVNTPAARAYVREFDAGRITPAQVQQRMVAEQGVTPDQRIARAAAEAPAQVDQVADRLARAAAQGMASPAPTDILNPSGEPFKTRMAADRAAKKTPGAVVPVEGGFVVRPQEPVNVQDVPQAPEVSQAAPVVSPPGQATQAVGAQPAGPAAGVPTEGAGAVEAAGLPPRGREGYDTPVTLDAASLKALVEKTRGTPLVDKPEKLKAWRNGTAKTDPAKFPIELAITPDGRLDVNDGRHRIALAAERGETVEAFIDGKDAQYARQLVSQPSQPQGAASVATPDQAQQAATQPTQAGAAQPTQGLTDAATAQNNGAQGTPAPGAQAQAPGNANWAALTPEQRRRARLEHEIATGKTNNGGVVASLRPSAIEKRKQELAAMGERGRLQGPAAPAPRKLPPKLAQKAAQVEAQRADYFTPGNVVPSYGGGHDRVVSYTPGDAQGNWNVRVQAVRQENGAWVNVPREGERIHATQPDARELKAGPVVRAPAAQAAESPTLQTAMGDAGWAGETGQGDTIWTKRANGERYTALLSPDAGSMEVTVLVGAVDTQIASFKVGDAKAAAEAANKAVAQDVAEQSPADDALPNGWSKSVNGYTKRPVYRMEQGGGQPFAVVTQVEGMQYEVQIRHGDKQLTVSKQTGALSEVLAKAEAELTRMTQADSVTHQDPGEKAEAATPGVVTDSLKKAARNEDTKPSEMRKWLVAEIDKELLQAADRPDYDEAVKRMGEKDAISMFTGNGPLGKNSETGYITFDVPGDGKYKVRNSVRGLLEFRKNVMASQGFKDSGQKRVKPEQNDGVQGGSGGSMTAIANMIDEGDFEAARDYAEAVGIKLEDVKVPRGDMKPAWEKYLKDGTLPAPPDTKPQPAPKTAAQVDEEKRQAAEAEAKKPKDTGWNMAGTGYGGKRYRGRNITTEDGREIVARVYENAGNYDEVEVKVDGVRKFTVRDSYNTQDKADAFIKTLTAGQPKADGVTQQISGNPERFIKVAADSVRELRKSDVDRVLTETPVQFRAEVASYIRDQRKDLADEVDGVMAEIQPKAAAPVPAPQPDTPKLTPAEAKSLMAWEDMGQKDGVKTHALTFYESQADKDAKRGRMIVAKVSKGDRSATAWMVDGEDKTFGMLAQAKKLAQEVGMAKAVADGYVEEGDAPMFSRAQAKEIRNLVTLHNLTDENLRYADSMGGIPVPSIGITKVESPFGGFGNITLIAPKGMIDPKAGVPVFDRDAWTARFPTMNFKKPKKAKADAFYERMKAMTKGSEVDEGNFLSNLWESMVNASVTDPDKVARHFQSYDAPRLAYARDVLQRPVKVPMKNVEPAEFFAHEKLWVDFVKRADWSKDNLAYDDPARVALRKEAGSAAKAAADAYIEKKIVARTKDQETADALREVYAKMGDRVLGDDGQMNYGIMERARSDAATVGTKRPDGIKLRDALDKVVKSTDPGYLRWVQNQVKPLFDEPTITLRGREVAPTLDNLVDAMTVGATAGAEKSMTFSPGKVAAMLGKQFKSLDEIKAARDQVVSAQAETEGKKATDALLTEYRTHVSQFYSGKDWRGNIDTWAANDDSMEALAKAGKLPPSDASIRATLARMNFKGVDQRAVDMAREAIAALRNAATDYFEAKPQRAVTLDEFKGAVVPKGTSAETLAILEKHGIAVEVHNKTEGAREKAIQKLAKRLDRQSGDVLFARDSAAPPSDSNARNVATQLLVDGLKAKWTRAPEIIVARNMQDRQIPQAVRDYDKTLKSQGATGEARGFIYKGKVYLLSDQLKGPQQIAEVLFHEVLGHYGLRGAFGIGLDSILQQMGTMRRKEVVAKAREYGLFDKDALGGLDKKTASDAQIWAAMSAKDRLSAAEEVLAEMAQSTPELGFVKRAIAAIRNWLRAHVPGFERMRLTDADIVQAYILPARGYVTRSNETAQQAIDRAMLAFSRAYHGTPHRGIEKFSTDKIGTGEGAQAYGWGLYFASNKEIAEHYRSMLTKGGDALRIDGKPPSFDMNGPGGVPGTRLGALGNRALMLLQKAGSAEKLDNTAIATGATDDVLNLAREMLPRAKWEKSGQLYEVDIPEDSEMLLWDKPLSEQPASMKQSARMLKGDIARDWLEDELDRLNADWDELTGQELYKLVQRALVADALVPNTASMAEQALIDGETDKAASLMLMDDGIKGIKYLDAASRADGDGSYNYVIFSGDDVAIQQTFFSRGQDQTQTEAFKRWFSGSKVVDADGKALVVYHGTTSDFSAFDTGMARAATGHRSSDLGIFTTADPAVASQFAGEFADENSWPVRMAYRPGSNVMPMYVSVKNPIRIPAREFAARFVRGDESAARFREDAIRAGHDGILIEGDSNLGDSFGGDEYGADAWVSFSPEQIKSAIGNNGQFDARNPDIRFSRTTDAAKAVGDTLKSITVSNVKERAGFKLTDYLGIGLQTLGRRQIVDIYGDLLPLAEYNRLVQQMEADKNEGGAEADQLVTRWAKLPDEGRLADLMHDATLAQIDPAKPYAKGDDKAQYQMLLGRFNALSDEAKQVYADTRNAYQAHHAKVRSAIKERIERSELKGERKKALLEQMDGEFFKAVKGVYFPLARFGQYAVTIKGPDGKVESVSRAETKAEAEALRSNLLEAFPRDKGFAVGRVMLSKDFIADRDAVGRGFMTELYQVLDKQDMDAAQRAELEDTLGQLYLSSLPDLSWAKHGIHRKGTPGFSQDARRAFAQNMFHGARYLAKLRYSDLMQDELAAMQRHVDDWREVEDFDQNSAQRVVDEMNKRHESLMNPKSNALSTALTSLGFVFHLGLSPASAMVNLSQTALVAYPIMGAKWGFGKASAALLEASKQAAQGRNDITKFLDKDELKAYNEAVRAGTIDVTMAHDLAGIAQGEDAGVMWKIRPVMRWASFLFHHAERFNRQVTFVAAYRLAREAGADHKTAFEQATKATYDGHFDYGAANRPRIMQGNVAKVLLLFKQYGQNMVYTLARNAQQSIKGESPEVRAQARKALGGLLATHAAAAGVLGLPMVTTLLAAASMIGGDDDEPWDAKVALNNMLADTFGQKPAEVMAHGLSRLTPWDISSRVGLDRLIFPDVQEGLEGRRLGEAAMAAALGPVAGIGINVLKGLQDMADGQYQRGLESMMPAALRGPIKAVRYESEGVQDKTGVVVKDEVSAAGVVGQLLGFSPSEVRLAQEGKSAIYQHDKALTGRREELLKKAARATRLKDAEARAEAMKEIERFNQKNPKLRITPLNVLQSVRNSQKRIDQAEGGVYLPKNRRDAMDAGRFAVSE